MFDFDSVSDLIRQPCNTYENQTHLTIQSGKTRILNSYLIAEAFQAQGTPVLWFSVSHFRVLGRKPEISFKNSYIRGHSGKGANKLLRHKDEFKKALADHDICVSPGKAFCSDEIDFAKEYVEKSKNRLVIKPTSGSKGRGVSVGINGLEHFDTGWKEALKANRVNDRVLVEEQFIGGTEVRFLVVAGRCVSAYRRIPPIVVGDGSSTVEQLIKEKNEIKSRNPHQYTRTIKINEHRKNVLAQQLLMLDSIPAKDALVLIDYKASASAGADTVEISDDISPEFMRLAEKVSLAAGSVPILGIDILAHDFKALPENTQYVVLEANTAPGLGGHLYPSYGKPIDVITPIVEHCLSISTPSSMSKTDKDYRVDIVSDNEDERKAIESIVLRKDFGSVPATVTDTHIELTSNEHKLSLLFTELASRENNLAEKLLIFQKPVTKKVEPAEDIKSLSLAIYGQVQGVGYRRWLTRQAKEKQVNGWVRNITDGSVAAELTGEPTAVLDLVRRCFTGPTGSKVTEISLRPKTSPGKKTGFQTLNTLSAAEPVEKEAVASRPDEARHA